MLAKLIWFRGEKSFEKSPLNKSKWFEIPFQGVQDNENSNGIFHSGERNENFFKFLIFGEVALKIYWNEIFTRIIFRPERRIHHDDVEFVVVEQASHLKDVRLN